MLYSVSTLCGGGLCVYYENNGSFVFCSFFKENLPYKKTLHTQSVESFSFLQTMSSEIESFHPVDYLVFALNLVISLGIGLYVGYGQKKASSKGGSHGGAQGGAQGGGTAQYHTAELNLIPVACSMVMSYISGLVVLGKCENRNVIVKP